MPHQAEGDNGPERNIFLGEGEMRFENQKFKWQMMEMGALGGVGW